MKKDGLSMKQIEAAELLAMSHKTEADIAEEIGISANTLKSWKGDIKFKVFVFQLFEQRLEYERNNRVKKMAKYLRPIYKAISRKLKDKEILRTLSLKDLLKIMAQLHFEIRQDKLVFKKIGPSKSSEEDESGRKLEEGEDEGDEMLDGDAVAMAKQMYLEERRSASGKVVPIKRAGE